MSSIFDIIGRIEELGFSEVGEDHYLKLIKDSRISTEINIDIVVYPFEHHSKDMEIHFIVETEIERLSGTKDSYSSSIRVPLKLDFDPNEAINAAILILEFLWINYYDSSIVHDLKYGINTVIFSPWAEETLYLDFNKDGKHSLIF